MAGEDDRLPAWLDLTVPTTGSRRRVCFFRQSTPDQPCAALAGLITERDGPTLSGDLTVVHSQATVPGTPAKVWKQASIPWSWLANHGTADPADFRFELLEEPDLRVQGSTVVDEPPSRLAFRWAWTTGHWAETERPRSAGEPTTVSISLRRAGNGNTAVELEQRDVPVELAGVVQPFWDWALQRALPDQVTRAAFYGHPWNRI